MPLDASIGHHVEEIFVLKLDDRVADTCLEMYASQNAEDEIVNDSAAPMTPGTECPRIPLSMTAWRSR